MSNNFDAMVQLVVKSLNDQHKIDVKFQERYGEEFFPENDSPIRGCSSYTINYNRRAEVLLSLYNLALFDGNNTAKAISHYVLFHIFSGILNYDNAEVHLHVFQQELKKVRSLHMMKEREEMIDTQFLFTLLHEAYHILFHYDSSLKMQAFETEKSRMQDIQTELSEALNLITFKELISHPKIVARTKSLIPSSLNPKTQQDMQTEMLRALFKNFITPEDYNPIISGENFHFLEELTCDRMAWLYIIELLKTSKSQHEEFCKTHLWLYVALNAMQFDWVLNTMYSKQKHSRIYKPKEFVIRQKSFKTPSRHYLSDIYEESFAKQYLLIADHFDNVFKKSVAYIMDNQEEFSKLYSSETTSFNQMKHKNLKQEMNITVKTFFTNNSMSMKKLLVYWVLLTVAPMVAMAQKHAFSNGLYWELNNGVLTISGNGAIPNYYGGAPWGSSSNIKKIVIEDGIYSIEDKVFSFYKNQQYVYIPQSVVSIGKRAFYDCENLNDYPLSLSYHQFFRKNTMAVRFYLVPLHRHL